MVCRKGQLQCMKSNEKKKFELKKSAIEIIFLLFSPLRKKRSSISGPVIQVKALDFDKIQYAGEDFTASSE